MVYLAMITFCWDDKSVERKTDTYWTGECGAIYFLIPES